MRNAYIGYTYQKHVTQLLLSLMDVERSISNIEIEAKTDDHFDDLVVTVIKSSYQFQIKDFESISLSDLFIKEGKIYLQGKPHTLSRKKNIIFFKHLAVKPTEEILGFPCYKLAQNVFLVSLSRVQIDERINNLYQNNPLRKNEIDSFFSTLLDKRIWQISRESLPHLKTFVTELQEKSVEISHRLLQFEKLLLIEGKPGVGKSHFVNTLQKKYKNSIVYRFWIGNQDRDYQERLKFSSFFRDINTKLFNDLKERSEDTILQKLQQQDNTFIIDGLDHVENYNKPEFDKFTSFINTLKEYCKVIVLSRPLINAPDWTRHILNNWNLKQTEKVLKELFHLDSYSIASDIFKISQGYPIIVKYLAEHYKLYHSLPNIAEVTDIDSYYQNVIADEKGKHSLSVFLCTKSYIMDSEMELFIGDEKYYVEEFIREHPYLFDIKLNRVSLFHDSFNTFLRKQIDYKHKKEKVSSIVTKSILKLEKRFQSRFSQFELSDDQNKQILIKYASINTFEKVINGAIDFEAVRVFYTQLRETLKNVNPQDLSVINYYDLSLISNLIIRDQFSTNNPFSYTYVQSLIYNGYIDDDITSSGYLFGMYYYVKTGNAVLLYNQTANDNYDTEYFHRELEHEVYKEESYISKHNKRFTKQQIDRALVDDIYLRDKVTTVIENFFIHQSAAKGYEVLKTCLDEYLNDNKHKSIYLLHSFLLKRGDSSDDYYSRWVLENVVKNLASYGYTIGDEKNEFQALTLKQLILKYKDQGSFNLGTKIHIYIRLALLEKRKIDIESISLYWTKYYNRKDYTLYSLPLALKTLETEKLISLKECIELIHKVQEMSEKGYRHLLAEFIELYHPSKIIPFLEGYFDVKDLRVDWFKLPVKYINKISDQTYNHEKNELLRYHLSFSIPFEEIENVLHSNRFRELEFTLDFFKAKIRYKNSQEKSIEKFKKSKLWFEKVIERDDYSKYKQSSQQRFDNGILTFDDIAFIKKKKLKSYDIAKFSDGNYTSLPHVTVFKIYEAKQISHHFKKILYNTLINKTRSINYFYSLYYHPGNILSMIKVYRNKEFNAAINSFKKFLELSMFELKLKE
ncbi:hypothetical protein [Niabella sp.]|uniref:hypothetical protein n=1 Tax=Niabella sp. TaxID=1962976 RepID=UPI002623C73D|nr:hypothetical protein [Niabella sp.]